MINEPSISVIVLSYNQERFIADSLNSILNQDYSNYEVVIADDCSTDSTVSKIEKILDRDLPIEVILRVNKSNLGIVGNLNSAMGLCQGDIVVVAAGDDISKRDRLTHIAQTFLKDNDVQLVFSDYSVIDENSKFIQEHTLAPQCASDLFQFVVNDTSQIFGAAAAWRRRIYDRFGNLNVDLRFEDRVLMARALILGKVAKISAPLISYRIHPKSITQSPKNLHKENRDLLNLNDMLAVYINIEKDLAVSRMEYSLEWFMVKRKIYLHKVYIAFLLSEISITKLLFKSLIVGGNPRFVLKH